MKNKLLQYLAGWQVQKVLDQLFVDHISCDFARSTFQKYSELQDKVVSEKRTYTNKEQVRQDQRGDAVTEYLIKVIRKNYE